MKRVFLLIVVPALLVALGFAQTPAASSNTDQINIKGCLGGSDGNYTVAEDNTGQIFKLTTSSVDLKPHLGHDVQLIGHKASGTVSSGAAENNLAVTELNMISEHCTAAAAAPVATASTPSETVSIPAAAAAAPAAAPAATVSTPSETVSTPAAAAAAPAAAPAATVSTPSETVTTPAAAAAAPAAAPAATVSTPSETVTTPAGAAAAPNTTVSASSETVSTPVAAAAHPTRPSARPQRLSATPSPAATPAATVSTPVAVDATPAAAVSTPSETVSTPAAAATKPATTAWGGSLWILVSFVVLVLVIGALAPLLNRWRKRKLLERTSAQNLSFTHEPSSDQGKSDTPVVRKAA
jgi:hypothetical protein